MKKVCVCGILFEKIIRSKYDADKGIAGYSPAIHYYIVLVVCKVDDGTGVVECVKFLNTPEDHLHASSLTVGTLIVVMGNLYLQHKYAYVPMR